MIGLVPRPPAIGPGWEFHNPLVGGMLPRPPAITGLGWEFQTSAAGLVLRPAEADDSCGGRMAAIPYRKAPAATGLSCAGAGRTRAMRGPVMAVAIWTIRLVSACCCRFAWRRSALVRGLLGSGVLPPVRGVITSLVSLDADWRQRDRSTNPRCLCPRSLVGPWSRLFVVDSGDVDDCGET